MLNRPIFTPVFEETETAIRERMLARVSDDWRKDPGDFIHDAIAPSPLEIKQLEMGLDFILKNGFAQYAEGEYLDLKLADVGLTRRPATNSKRALSVTGDPGVRIPRGHVITTVVLDNNGDPIAFETKQEIIFSTDTPTRELALVCSLDGTIGNVPTGAQFILQPPIAGVRSITDLGTTVPGEERENDLDAYKRYMLRVQNPDTGGNKNDYVRWVQDNIEGVGKAVCVPRWQGNGTVQVVIVDLEYKPAAQVLVNQVQNYLDPLPYQGLGYGKAPAGAAVTVTAATDKPISITATVTYAIGTDPAVAKATFMQAVTEYLRSIVFLTDPITGNLYPVAYNKIGALLITTKGIENYSNLQVNGGTVDIPLIPHEVATLGAVTI